MPKNNKNEEIKVIIVNPEAIEKAKERFTECVYNSYLERSTTDKNIETGEDSIKWRY
ncbi:hypothetical protein [Abyssisolibacter fermentans]|uniref:hypothetical protein n=1 Tax=Abyssisolibacter fermentans TaxID=1766203 RepID=UPI00138F4D90|nr:hypothetical protein [Abyssisolibacter fermentans]